MTPPTMPAGRELDAVILERVFGWKPDATRCPVCGWPLRADVTLGCVPGNCSMRPAPLVRYDALAHYSTEDAAALAALARVGGIVTIQRRRPDDWRVQIADKDTWWAETLPLAICRALLDATTAGEVRS